jgi:hypothetical protein
MSSFQEKNGGVDKNNEEITGFIIRKCFYLLREHHDRHNFFIQDQILLQILNKCLSMTMECSNSRTILVIFQSLLVMKKL